MKSFESLEIHLRIPDLWQQQALASLRQGRDVVVHAPTGAGKTHLVELLFSSNFKKQIVHSVPTRALANDKLREWKDKGWRVGIVTGDLSVDADAPLVVATLETQKQRFIEGEGPGLFVVDEYQMLGDSVRGINYELTIAMTPPQTGLLLLSGSVSNPEAVVDWLKRMGRDPVLVKTEDRPVPLEEVRLEALNYNPPKAVRGFWPRLMARALMGDLGPVLLFAPKRSESEKLAKHLA
ncbi:MAG: DEAD/DEAH box helicase, partial [Opitutales bacterium]